MRRLSIVLALLIATSCGPVFATPQPSPQFAYYQYIFTMPTTPLEPDDQLHLVWEPHLAPGRASAVYPMQLCVALFGPWETVGALKTAMSAGPAPACPSKGAVVSSETLRTTSNSGVRLTTDLIVPAAPGFYDIHQISIYGEGTATSATAAGGIIEVRRK